MENFLSSAMTFFHHNVPSDDGRYHGKLSFMFVVGLLIFFLVSTKAAHADKEDFQIWTPVYLTVSHSDKIQGWYEVQPRFGENASEVNQLLLRLALGYKLDTRWSLWQGYAWTPAFVPEYINENRIYQQLLYLRKWPTSEILVSRSRLEWRWIENVPGTAVRFRTLLRGQYPFDEEKVWSLVAQDEIFVNFNSPPNGPAAGFDQNRLFFGLNRKVNDHLYFDGGYQWQTLNTKEPGFIDDNNHILLIQCYLIF